MPICSRCRVPRSNADFAVKNKRTGKLRTQCRECVKSYKSKHYAGNKTVYLAKQALRNKLLRKEMRLRICELLLGHQCACGESDIRVLDFDHKDPSDKSFTISDVLRSGTLSEPAWERILKEIEKCDVRCANCHRKRTAEYNSDVRHVFYLEKQAPMGLTANPMSFKLSDLGSNPSGCTD